MGHYVQLLVREIEASRRLNEGPLRSVFFGGGAPRAVCWLFGAAFCFWLCSDIARPAAGLGGCSTRLNTTLQLPRLHGLTPRRSRLATWAQHHASAASLTLDSTQMPFSLLASLQARPPCSPSPCWSSCCRRWTGGLGWRLGPRCAAGGGCVADMHAAAHGMSGCALKRLGRRGLCAIAG